MIFTRINQNFYTISLLSLTVFFLGAGKASSEKDLNYCLSFSPEILNDAAIGFKCKGNPSEVVFTVVAKDSVEGSPIWYDPKSKIWTTTVRTGQLNYQDANANCTSITNFKEAGVRWHLPTLYPKGNEKKYGRKKSEILKLQKDGAWQIILAGNGAAIWSSTLAFSDSDVYYFGWGHGVSYNANEYVVIEKHKEFRFICAGVR